ncbi:glycosyltransferase family 4 protein [Litoribacter populi]|uniref:glycosyltransferase family 4 protein n=1 Tax=Litoribacter populi TaxID=2598460 RepID=UPI00117DA047|nr:glycosyltransferase family 4 protein [Litoribacter populi]
MNRDSLNGKYALFLHGSADLYGSSLILLFVVESALRLGLIPIVVLPYRGQLSMELQKRGVRVEIQNLGVLRRKYFNPLGLLNRIQKLSSAYRFLAKLHKENRLDLVYSNTLAVLIGAFFSRRKGISHIWHVHEIIPSPTFLVKFLAAQMQRSDNILAVSHSVAQHWEKYGVEKNVKVIHNGIPYRDVQVSKPAFRETLGIMPNHKVVTMVGRVNPGKGQMFFLEMAKEILMKRTDVVFLMAGDPYPGYEYILEEIQVFIKKNKVGNNVIDLGFRSDIAEILAISDIFVLPSILPDSFPTVILEAMGAGLPVVATRSGGSVEMVLEGETGHLIPVSDVQSGVNSIVNLLEDEELRKGMGVKSQARAKQAFGLLRFNEEIENYFYQVLQEKKS